MKKGKIIIWSRPVANTGALFNVWNKTVCKLMSDVPKINHKLAN
uniref:Bm1630 n=1 Tax=Brugia malayi TaxID=6279 RepID=A0A1I9G601_BRUMA|nr:Bm1630 [Brugia malayi]